jgi:xylulokinase
LLVGIDLGTTNVKAVAVEPSGEVVATGAAPVETWHIGADGVEQDAEQICDATVAALTALGKETDLDAVRAVGISSQGGAMLFRDASGEPAGRVISWLDGRGAAHNARLTKELGSEWFASRIGHGGAGITFGQVLRLRESGALGEDSQIGFVGDEIVRRLCGRAAHDATSLSLGMLYNPALRQADPDALRQLGLDESRLPDLLAPCQPAGGITAEAARLTGLPRGIPVSSAVHDQYAAALGCGAVHPGDVMFGAGTAWVLLAVSEDLPPALTRGAFICTHVVEGLYGQILSLGNGGSSVAWAARLVGQEDANASQLEALIRSAPPGCEGLRCHPLFAGSGAGRAGRLEGIRLSHTPGHLLRSVVEGLACELARTLALLAEAGPSPKRLLMCGAAATGETTPQIIADVTGLPVERHTGGQTSALGAAILARAILEPGKWLGDVSETMAPTAPLVEPGSDRDLYRTLFEQYVGSSSAP